MSAPLLLIPHLRIHNANALSSPFTIGFPAMTAWLGAVHALQRHLNAQGVAVQFDGVGIISHQFDLQTYKGPGDYEYSIIGTANPVDKDGSRSAFIEEARCHLEVSLVIQCQGLDDLSEDTLLHKVSYLLSSRIKMAGGDIRDFNKPTIHRNFERLRAQLMPGYALIERRELMTEAMEQGQDALDALLDCLAIHHDCEQQDHNDETSINWSSGRKENGWLIPVATGFHGISELGQAKNQRDPDTLHRFAESIITLGEFKMPYNMKTSKELLWHYRYDADNSLYLCQQSNAKTQLETQHPDF